MESPGIGSRQVAVQNLPPLALQEQDPNIIVQLILWVLETIKECLVGKGWDQRQVEVIRPAAQADRIQELEQVNHPNLQPQIDQLQGQLQEAAKARQVAEQTLAGARQENEQLNARISEIHRTNQETIGEITSAMPGLQERAGMLESLQVQHNALQEELAKLQGNSKIEPSSLDLLLNDYSALSSKYLALANRVLDVTGDSGLPGALKAQREALQGKRYKPKQYDELLGICSTVITSIDPNREQSKELESLQTQHSQLKQRCTEEPSYQAYQQYLRQNDPPPTLLRRYEELNDLCSGLGKEHRNTLSELEEARAAMTEKAELLSGLQEKVGILESLQARHDALQQDYHQLEETNQKLLEDEVTSLESYKNKMQELQTQRESAQLSYDALLQQYDQLAQQHKTEKEEASQLTEQQEQQISQQIEQLNKQLWQIKSMRDGILAHSEQQNQLVRGLQTAIYDANSKIVGEFEVIAVAGQLVESEL